MQERNVNIIATKLHASCNKAFGYLEVNQSIAANSTLYRKFIIQFLTF